MARPDDAFDPAQTRLRPLTPSDLPILFLYQSDPESNLVAMTKPRSFESFTKVMSAALADPRVVARVIVAPRVAIPGTGAPPAHSRGETPELILGSISCFQMEGLDAVGYWIAREHWGRGVASRAVPLLLTEVTRRPLHASVAASNAASIRVLQKCGFRATGTSTEAETDRYRACEVVSFVLD